MAIVTNDINASLGATFHTDLSSENDKVHKDPRFSPVKSTDTFEFVFVVVFCSHRIMKGKLS